MVRTTVYLIQCFIVGILFINVDRKHVSNQRKWWNVQN